MRGLQPFYRGLYRLASRGSRTAAAVGSRVEFCGTQTSAKVRNDRPVCVSLPTRRHLKLSSGSVRSATLPDAAALARAEDAVGHRAQRQRKRCFSSTKKAQKKHICESPNTACADAGGLFVLLTSLWLSVMVSVDGGGLSVGDENNNNN